MYALPRANRGSYCSADAVPRFRYHDAKFVYIDVNYQSITFRPRGQKSTIGCMVRPAPRAPGGAGRPSGGPGGLPSPPDAAFPADRHAMKARFRLPEASTASDPCNLSHLFGHRRGNSRGWGAPPAPGRRRRDAWRAARHVPRRFPLLRRRRYLIPVGRTLARAPKHQLRDMP